MKSITQCRHGVPVVGTDRHDLREHILRFCNQSFTVEGPAHGEHELYVLFETQVSNLPKEGEGLLSVPQAEKGLPHSDQSFFVERIQGQGLMERSPGPGEFFPGQPGVSEAHVEVHGVGIERKALSKHLEGPVKIPVVVKPVRPFVVFL
jgi:hypothetical protein